MRASGFRAPGLGRLLTLFAGIGLLAYIASWTDLTEVWNRLVDLGAWGALAVCAVYFTAFLVDTASWQLMLPGVRLDTPWLYRLWKGSLIVRIRQEYNRDRQRELTHQLHRLIHEDQPYTFLYAPLSTRVLDKKIVLVQNGADGKEEYQKIYPLKSGNIFYYFYRWRKLEFTPDF